MELSVLFDFVAVAVIVISAMVMSKRGLIKSVYKLVSVAVTIIAVISLGEQAESILVDFGVDSYITASVSDAVIEENDLPEFYSDVINDVKEQTIVPAISGVILTLVGAIAVYIIVKILLYIVFLLIKGIFKMPVLREVNAIAGIAAGVVSGLVIIYLFCGIISLDISELSEIRQIIDKTVVLKHFYDRNVLMELFLN